MRIGTTSTSALPFSETAAQRRVTCLVKRIMERH
jgi:hypothetical protein